MDTNTPYWAASQSDKNEIQGDTSIDPQFQHSPAFDDHQSANSVTQAPTDGSQGSDGQSDSQASLLNKQGKPLSQTRRAAQNRAAQRAFRRRKEEYIKDLEHQVRELKSTRETMEALRQENLQLRDYILALQSRLIEHPTGVPTPPAVFGGTARNIATYDKNSQQQQAQQAQVKQSQQSTQHQLAQLQSSAAVRAAVQKANSMSKQK